MIWLKLHQIVGCLGRKTA